MIFETIGITLNALQRDSGVNDVETGFSAYHVSNYDAAKKVSIQVLEFWT